MAPHQISQLCILPTYLFKHQYRIYHFFFLYYSSIVRHSDISLHKTMVMETVRFTEVLGRFGRKKISNAVAFLYFLFFISVVLR